ncbi:MAG: hypothetical protein A7315_10715 [Candidatus Altiarchaeales archaeon WOR_SM1_79]|nr:MAG: hypothetical protein A7315_10715 [Candidatus Altiarchaeales archaeon WOR_SM1_79]
MRVLCIADIHGDMGNIPGAAKFAKRNDIECVFIAGDFSRGIGDMNENRRDVEYVLKTFKDFRVFCIPGNCDSREIPGVFDEYGVNFHEKVMIIEGITFICLGGSNPTPFKTPFELSEDEIYGKLKSTADEVDTAEFIVMSHFPPKDTACDEIQGGFHVGSEALRRFIEEYSPKLAVSSHIHENGGREDKVGDTKIANIGRVSERNCGVIELPGADIELFKF